MTRRCIGALVALLSAAPAFTQDVPFTASNTARPVIRPDGTYFFKSAPNADLVFEAQIAPRIIIMDSIRDATARLFDTASPAESVWGWQLSATPMVKLRMFNSVSSPVRTPSYMPKGTIQVARFRSLSSAADKDERQKAPVAMWLIDVIPFGHHSNGQEQCLFTTQSRNAAGDCVETPGSSGKAVNKLDGSFSTNYVEAGLYYGRIHLQGGVGDQASVTRTEWRLGGALQLNPKGYLPGSIDDELAPLYGTTRVSFEAMAAGRDAWKCRRLQGQARVQYIRNGPAGMHPFIYFAESSCLPRSWGGAGLFVRLYSGQDYYNLGFAESITRLQFGVALQPATFLSFRLSPLGQ